MTRMNGFWRRTGGLACLCLCLSLALLVYDLWRAAQLSTLQGSCVAEFMGNDTGFMERLALSLGWKSPPPPQTLMFLRAVARHASSDRVILLAFTDTAFVSMAVNFYLTSLKPFGITNYLFACSDTKCCELLRVKNITCEVYRADDASNERSRFGTKTFLRKMNVRTDMVLDILQAGYTVLHSDTDIVFLKNPFRHFTCREDCDIAALMDTIDYNAGFIYIRPTPHSMAVYRNMQRIAAEKPKMDDQDQLTLSISQKSRMDKSFKAVKLPENKFQCGYYYFEKEHRVFAGDKLCDDCVVVHNNWIVSMEAKVYRFKEHLMWMVDDTGQYYGSETTGYITYNNPVVLKDAKATKALEKKALENAFTLAILLNRTVILPAFHTSEKGYQHASLNFAFKVADVDKHLGNLYREHMFLKHPSVPDTVKTSKSKTYLVWSDKINSTLSANSIKISDELKVLKLKRESGATEDEVVKWFGGVKQSVLQFHSLYHDVVSIKNEQLKKQIAEKLKKGLVDSTMRQY